jgi:hypothetical protein
LIVLNASNFDLNGIRLSVDIGRGNVPPALVVLSKIQRDHGGYGRLAFDTPFKPRTIPANRKFHALVSSLAVIWGVSSADAKRLVKEEATALGYRTETKRIGKRWLTLPVSEADASTEEEAWLIEAALKMGAEEGRDLEAEYQARLQEEQLLGKER